MSNYNTSMRLKVNRDTFYMPDPVSGVFFRNNLSSFRMEGEGIDRWIEKLLPAFNGEHTLAELTDGLPEPHRMRVVEIADALLKHGFVRDVSQDAPYRLSEGLLTKYASQIEFLDHFGGSGAFRFQTYRQAKVLAIGSGPFMASLVSALLESGLPRFHVSILDSASTDRKRLAELVSHARKTDGEVTVEEVSVPTDTDSVSGWQEMVKAFDVILYVSPEENVEELRSIHKACREENKLFLPALCLKRVGWAGPLVHSESEGDWESAWRRVHRSALGINTQVQGYSSTAGALLANMIVFEGMKKISGISSEAEGSRVYLLNSETLEGSWHSFMPHPLAEGRAEAKWIRELDREVSRDARRSKDELLSFFGGLTSEYTGIFHIWDEGDLQQLPLSQCRVQAADPQSEGPAGLLEEIICAEISHLDARHAAGLSGIEAYAARLSECFLSELYSDPWDRIMPQEFVGVGAGLTFAEGVGRGLHKWLNDELEKQSGQRIPLILTGYSPVIEDERCQYYLRSLETLNGPVMIGHGERVAGFPTVWVGTNGYWFGGAGLNVTFALRNALKQALMKEQNQNCATHSRLELRSVLRKEEGDLGVIIPNCEMAVQADDLTSALKLIKQNRKQLLVFDMTPEPLFRKALAGVFGVLLREEGSR